MVQQFLLLYECQACKSAPEAILVRREDLLLTIAGRSPMEFVEVHRDVPPVVQGHFRAAVLAHRSGQTLPGVFMLRTTIEQWVYSQHPADPSDWEEAIDWYMQELPEDFKRRFPSLRKLYGDLSADMHSATGSEDLFADVADETVRHFEALRLYELFR